MSETPGTDLDLPDAGGQMDATDVTIDVEVSDLPPLDAEIDEDGQPVGEMTGGESPERVGWGGKPPGGNPKPPKGRGGRGGSTGGGKGGISLSIFGGVHVSPSILSGNTGVKSERPLVVRAPLLSGRPTAGRRRPTR